MSRAVSTHVLIGQAGDQGGGDPGHGVALAAKGFLKTLTTLTVRLAHCPRWLAAIAQQGASSSGYTCSRSSLRSRPASVGSPPLNKATASSARSSLPSSTALPKGECLSILKSSA